MSGEFFKPTHGEASPEGVDVPFGDAEYYARLVAAAEEVEDITGAVALSTFAVGVINIGDSTIRELTIELRMGLLPLAKSSSGYRVLSEVNTSNAQCHEAAEVAVVRSQRRLRRVPANPAHISGTRSGAMTPGGRLKVLA